MPPSQDIDLHRLAYLSSAKDDLPQPELDAILEVSREKNRERQITGLLLYHDCQFFQALEGRRSDVDEVFARIRKDRLHTGCIVLESRAVPSRLFDGWAMAYLPMGRLTDPQKQGFRDLASIPGDLPEREANGDARTCVLIDSFLRSFREFDLD